MVDIAIWVSVLGGLGAATVATVRFLARRHDPAPLDSTVGVHTELARGEAAGPQG